MAAIEQAAGAEPEAIIGLTANSYRNDARSMLSLLPVCTFARSIPEIVQEGYLAPLTIPKRRPAREVIVNLREDSMSTHWYDTTSQGERAAQLPPRSVLIRIEKQRSSSWKDGEHVPRHKYHHDRVYQLMCETGPGSTAMGYVCYSSERKQMNGAIQIIQASPGG